MRFKIDWASLVGSEFTVFALFYSLFDGSFPSTSPRGAYIWKIALKYEVKQSKNGKFTSNYKLAQSILKRKFPSSDKPLRK